MTSDLSENDGGANERGDSAPSQGAGDASFTVARDAGSTPAPPSGEICGDGLDNNKNGNVDEGCSCQEGATQKCYAGNPAQAGKGSCTFGTQTCQKSGAGEFTTAAWSRCEGSGQPETEICNGKDDNCDGVVDEGCHPCTKYISVPAGVVSAAYDCGCANVPASVTYCSNSRGGSRGTLPSPLVDASAAPTGAALLGKRWVMTSCSKQDGWDADTWAQSKIYSVECLDCSASAADPICRTP